MAREHGINGQVQFDTAGGSSLVIVGDLNSWTLNMGKDRQVVTAFNDTNVRRVTGLPDFSGTMGGWWNADSSPAFFDAVLGNNAITLRLIPNKDEPLYYFQGLANLDGALNVSATGAASISGNWDAADNWVMNP
jgi:hypothetical protein